MESAQQPSDADQFAVPAQRIGPDQAAMVQPPQTEAVRTADIPTQRTISDQGASESVPPSPPSRRCLRSVLAVLGGMLALLCLGGVGIAYVVYDSATGPDRSAPDVVVSNYLRVYLVERDDIRASLYICKNSPDLNEIQLFRKDLDAREVKFAVHIQITWGSLAVEPADAGKRVTTEVWQTIADGSEQRHDRWQFDVVDQDGWRVCGAQRLASPR